MNILLIDDEPSWIKAVQNIMPDIVVSTERLPGFDKVLMSNRFLGKVDAKGAVVLTNSSGVIEAIRAYRAGAIDYKTKDFGHDFIRNLLYE